MDFSIAPLTYSLIAINVLVSVFAWYNRPFMDQNIFHMDSVINGRQYHRVLTSAFLHADPMHLLFNMMTLYFFGPTLEALLGTTGFATVYFGSQLGAKALTIYRNRKNSNYLSLGAFGAISGIVIAFCLYAPMTTLFIFGILPLPAFIFAGLFLAYSSFAMGGPGRIAHEAHLGGAITGGLLFAILAPGMIAFF